MTRSAMPIANFRIVPTIALSVLMTCFFWVSFASAQLNIQIGGNEADFKARLAADGYDRIDTVKLGLSGSKFDACKDGNRFRIDMDWTGRIERKVIGECRRIVDEPAIRKILNDKGYRRITIEDRAGKFLAIGCLRSDRFRVELNYYGDIINERKVGSCQEVLSPEDIIAKLEEAGYNRIAFTDRRLPVYVAEACRENDRVELSLDQFGEIRGSRKIGQCRPALQLREIIARLQEKGYRDVSIIDPRLPRYIAQGCKNGGLMEITLNRWGEVTNEVRVGRCQNRLSEDEIIASMTENGYRNVSVQQVGQNFVTRGCRDARYEEFVLSQSGNLVSRKPLGNCNAPRINDLAETLRSRGLTRLQFYLEACENRQRTRIRFDEFANRTGTEIIGKC